MTGVAEQVAGLDATAQAALVAAGDVSAVELTEAAIERIERLNPLLGAVVTPLYDRALAATARASGPFAGVPFLLKDLVAEIEGTPFAEGSAYVHGTVSTFTSELVHRLERAGLEIEDPLQLELDARHVVGELLAAEQVALLRLAAGVADHAGRPSGERERAVPRHLEPAQPELAHQMAGVQRVGGGIEPDVDADRPLVEARPEELQVGRVVDETTRVQVVDQVHIRRR